MLVTLIVILLLVALLNLAIRKNSHAQENLEVKFWDRERAANFSRRKDISHLPYLIIPEEKIPQNLDTNAEKKLRALCGKKMLNLAGKTNTDLKLAYGVANLEELSDCDERFCTFVTNVGTYAKELVDAGQTELAKELLSLAISHQADSSIIYVQLAEIYEAEGNPDKIDELFEAADKLPTLPKMLVVERLTAFLP